MKILTLIFSLPALFLMLKAKPNQPNIIYLMCDELAYYELSHMGNYKIKTPNIDRFARQGIRFTHALAASPVCAPLRCNLMTGNIPVILRFEKTMVGLLSEQMKQPLPPC